MSPSMRPACSSFRSQFVSVEPMPAGAPGDDAPAGRARRAVSTRRGRRSEARETRAARRGVSDDATRRGARTANEDEAAAAIEKSSTAGVRDARARDLTGGDGAARGRRSGPRERARRRG